MLLLPIHGQHLLYFLRYFGLIWLFSLIKLGLPQTNVTTVSRCNTNQLHVNSQKPPRFLICNLFQRGKGQRMFTTANKSLSLLMCWLPSTVQMLLRESQQDFFQVWILVWRWFCSSMSYTGHVYWCEDLRYLNSKKWFLKLSSSSWVHQDSGQLIFFALILEKTGAC